MSDGYLVLLAPSANRVYTRSAADLAAAELSILDPQAGEIRVVELAGVRYLSVAGEPNADALSRFSFRFAVFHQVGDLLRPVAVPALDRFDDDLVSIPKYPGKTNEQFTRLLLNVTIAAVTGPPPFSVLDPLCGRGTTLTTAWTLGHDGAGVEADGKAVEAMQGFLSSYLQRKRISHSVRSNPVRRDGRVLGRRLQASARPDGGKPLQLTVFTGDTIDTPSLFGKRRFDAVVTDAPYGFVHGASRGRRREHSPEELLAAALPVWAEMLRPGGALGLAWNTVGMPRARLIELIVDAGLIPRQSEPYLRLSHRVDSSIHRDVLVATRE